MRFCLISEWVFDPFKNLFLQLSISRLIGKVHKLFLPFLVGGHPDCLLMFYFLRHLHLTTFVFEDAFKDYPHGGSPFLLSSTLYEIVLCNCIVLLYSSKQNSAAEEFIGQAVSLRPHVN